MALLPDLKKGKRGAIAKAISIMENDPKEARKLIKKSTNFLVNHCNWNNRPCWCWKIIS